MTEWWKKLSAIIQIGILLFTAGVAWAGVSAQSEKLTKLEGKYDRLEQVVVDMRISLAEIKQSVKNIERSTKDFER